LPWWRWRASAAAASRRCASPAIWCR
jgi:hypothetical protein